MKISSQFCFILFLLTFLAFSCKEDEPEKPLVIQKIIENVNNCICEPFINEYIWQDKTVYVLAFRGSTCNTVPAYYYENGLEFAMEEGYTYDDFLEDSILVEDVWTCQE